LSRRKTLEIHMSVSIQGIRGTGQFNEQFRPRNYRELFTLLEPNGNAPLNALLAMTSAESTDDPEYRNFRDELPDRRMVAAAGATNVATTITLTASDNNRYAIAGATVCNVRTGEVMQVTADTTGTTLTVTRGVGGTGIAVNANDGLAIIGYAAQEGGNSPTAVSFDAELFFNYTQIFKTAFSVTNTQKATKLRTGDKLEEAQTKALKLHMSDIERAMFFGRKAEVNGTSAQPTRYTGGLLNELANTIDIGVINAGINATAGTLTENEFDRQLISQIFAYGSTQKIAFCGATTAANLQRIAKARWQPTEIANTYGVNLTGYKTFAGDLMVHLHPQFRQLTEMANAMVIVDFPYLKYRYLEGRDTQLIENLQATDADQEKHQYQTECGLELTQSRVHTVIRNWSSI
jgi:hypothetical protein